jgi:hypothetical protein
MPARNCHRLHIEAGSIPRPPTDPTGYVQPPGCAESTFVGSDFDIEQVALQGVGSTVQALVDQERVGDSITILCSVPVSFLDEVRVRDSQGAPWYDRAPVRHRQAVDSHANRPHHRRFRSRPVRLPGDKS